MRKTFIVDTSVLLYDKTSIHSFPENNVIIPLVVLDELDRFKDKKGFIGESARYVNRYLDNLRENGTLHSGIELENGQIIKVAMDGFDNVPAGLVGDYADNQMIAMALKLKDDIAEKGLIQKVVVITKDINFRVKCDALGIKSQDYYKDKVLEENDEHYKGFIELEMEDPWMIDALYNGGDLLEDVEDLCERKLNENEFISIRSGSQSFIGFKSGNKIEKLRKNEELEKLYVKPRNREQQYALSLLTREDVPLVTLTGIAGSGKTFLTLMSGLEGLNKGKYKRIVITRNIQPVGRDIGFLPGDADDKMLPWIAPILDNFRQGMKDKDLTYFHAMKAKGAIEVAPLAFMRGRTFSDTFLIIDESQNCTIHELKTVITRIGENSKIVLLGDTDQIDTPYIDSLSNGLTVVAEKFKDSSLAGHVQLQKGERSSLSFLATSILK